MSSSKGWSDCLPYEVPNSSSILCMLPPSNFSGPWYQWAWAPLHPKVLTLNPLTYLTGCSHIIGYYPALLECCPLPFTSENKESRKWTETLLLEEARWCYSNRIIVPWQVKIAKNWAVHWKWETWDIVCSLFRLEFGLMNRN